MKPAKDCSETNDGGADEPPPYIFTEQIGHLLRRAYQHHLAIFQANAADPNLTSTQFVTLCALRDKGPCSQADLIQATSIDQATIRGIIDRLARRGLVRLQTDPADKRRSMVTLTQEGDTLLEQTVPRARLISTLTMDRLNPAERIALMFTLRKMIGL